MNDIVKKADAEVTVQPINEPTQLIQMAIQHGADVGALERLMDLQERHEAKIAKRAFVEAMAKFQSEMPRITKNKTGHNFSYAPLGDIQIQIAPHMKANGLTYRYEQEHTDDRITVECIVTHIDGHSEKTSMFAFPDDTGSKNSIQARGSTVTYLMRYTLIGALGLVTADQDVDGRLPDDSPSISADELIHLNDLIKEKKGNVQKLCRFFKVESLEALTEKQYAQAVDMLNSRG